MGLFFLFFNVFTKTFTQPFQQLPIVIGLVAYARQTKISPLPSLSRNFLQQNL
jgi:hypothetical protein